MKQRQQQKENPGHNCLGISLKVAKQVEDKKQNGKIVIFHLNGYQTLQTFCTGRKIPLNLYLNFYLFYFFYWVN